MATAEAGYLETAPAPLSAGPAVSDVGDQQAKAASTDNGISNFEPISLASSNHSDQSENVTTSTSGEDDEYDDEQGHHEEEPIKCSAVHTLERDMPDCDYSHLVVQLRQLILEHAKENPGTYSQRELDKCATDDWYVSRFLLRHKLDLDAAFDMLKKTMRFNHESLATTLRPEDFPAEFYLLGGLFPYGQDRKGNKMLYLRVKLHRKTPDIASVIHAFIYFNIKRLDEEAQGKGISVVIDCAGGGLSNADMDTLGFLVSTLKNYFPKGLSYFLIHEIPWILKPFWHIAKSWLSEEHRALIKFSDASNILEYIDKDNLPEYLGGTGALGPASVVPDNCTTLEQAAKLWGIDRRILLRVLDKYRDLLPEKSVKRIEDYCGAESEDQAEEKLAQDE